MSRSRKRPHGRRVLPWIAPAAAATAVTAVFLASALASRSPSGSRVSVDNAADTTGTLQATYQAGTNWGTGYSGQYTISNPGTSAVSGWTLGFTLPGGTSLSSLWDGTYTVHGGQVTVASDDWDATLQPGASVTVGFVTTSLSGAAGQPSGCTINGAACDGGGGPAPSASATGSASAPPTAAPPTSAPPTSAPPPSATSAPSASPTSPTGPGGSSSAGSAGFTPYADTSLYPPFNLVSTAQRTGAKQFNLAFVVSGGGGCTPEWGGVSPLGSDPVATQIGALRAIGGDVRISFGGANGSELATTCTSASQLAAAYQQVISAYNVNKLDFDVEGAGVANTAANARRDQALAMLEAQDKGLAVSFTLPVLPSGLTPDGVALLDGVAQAGVQVAAVNVMAMDYGDGPAPSPAGKMGSYAIDAATATEAQVASAFGISGSAAWAKIAVTPMIGVNDTSDEVFTVADAQQLVAFAASKHLAWLSMWSAARDTQCPGGAQSFAQPTCSGIVQGADAFAKALGAY
jgi:hypothetical protein